MLLKKKNFPGYNIKSETLLSILCDQKKKKKILGIKEKVKHYLVFSVIKKLFFFLV